MGDVDAAAVPCGFGRAIGNKVYLVSLFTTITASSVAFFMLYFEKYCYQLNNYFCTFCILSINLFSYLNDFFFFF